ncbi:peptide chain release factor 3 [Klebsiella pneumoniae]|uniref:Peptide chain release factor 3 n=1 Tax=Klebsiella pneumoniae TaxID=573 RepID=A0A378FXI5_KLEPN|nr:peptide chain release factor 3 [Klebsiella pneumoniae]
MKSENELKIGLRADYLAYRLRQAVQRRLSSLQRRKPTCIRTGKGHTIQEVRIVKGLNNPDLDAAVGEDLAQQLRDELEWCKGGVE